MVRSFERSKGKSSCVFCGKTPHFLPVHLLRHIGERPFHCGVCKKEFNRERNKKTHEAIHGQRKRFSCGVCKKRFQRKGDLTRHTKLVHSNDRPHPCPQCSYRAQRKSYLEVHLMYHNGHKKFKCSLCTKRFITSGDRRKHLRTHTGEKAYKCPVCPKSFTGLYWGNNHLRCLHLREKVHICKKCGEEFGYAKGLSQHKQICKKRGATKKITTAPVPFSVVVTGLLLLLLLS